MGWLRSCLILVLCLLGMVRMALATAITSVNFSSQTAVSFHYAFTDTIKTGTFGTFTVTSTTDSTKIWQFQMSSYFNSHTSGNVTFSNRNMVDSACNGATRLCFTTQLSGPTSNYLPNDS